MEEAEAVVAELFNAMESPAEEGEAVESAPVAEPEEGAPEEAQPEEQEEVAEEPKKDSFAAKFAALSRKEKKLLDKGREIKEFETRLKGQQSKIDEYESFKNLSKSNPIEAMKMAGIDYEDVTHRILNKGERSTRQIETDLRNELDTLREEHSTYRKQAEDTRARNEVNRFIANVNEYIDNNNEKYDLLSSEGARNKVINTADRYAVETGEIPDIAEVCDYVESELKKEAASLFASDSFLKKMGLVKSESLAEKSIGSKAGKPKTLTNSLTSSSEPASGDNGLTEEERLDKAASMLIYE